MCSAYRMHLSIVALLYLKQATCMIMILWLYSTAGWCLQYCALGILQYLLWISSSSCFLKDITFDSNHIYCTLTSVLFNGPLWRLHAGTLLQLSLFDQKDVIVVAWSKLEGLVVMAEVGWVVTFLATQNTTDLAPISGSFLEGNCP